MSDSEHRRTLAALIRQSHAHVGVNRALEGFSWELAGRQIGGFNHTLFEKVEHLRLAAEDLVSYCLDDDYEELGWPDGYWPDRTAPESEEEWNHAVERFHHANEAMAALVEDADHDLLARVPTAEKDSHHTLRAALILLDHNGYHVGQIVAQRIALGAWPPA